MTKLPDHLPRIALIGVLAGFFSGLFGVGGGIIIVPLLILMLRFTQRQAGATSLAAILPTVIAGTIGYAVQGSVDWVAGGALAVGAVAGSLLGTWLMHRIPQGVLRWIFIALLLVVAVRMFFFIPDRSAELEHSIPVVLVLVAVGVATGILSGLLGLGGGVIVVPVLMLLFGMGDLVAKGTSLLMMIPTSITGTIANARRGHPDLRVAAVVGVLAVASSVGGVALAAVISPQLSSILFAVLLVYSIVQLTINAARSARRGD